MTTRFYLNTGDVSPGGLTPAFDASWEQTTSAVRARMTTYKQNSAFTSLAISESSASSNFDFLFRQYISDPLNAGSVSGTVKGVIRCLEGSTDSDFRAQMLIKLISGDGTSVTGTLLAHDASALSNEFDATTLTNRKFPLNWAGAGTTLSSVTANQGDRLVFELGVRSFNVISAARTATLRFGDHSATDLAENETGTTDDNPWIEVSQTLSFEAFVSERRGQDEKLFTETGNIVKPHGAGISYARFQVLDANFHSTSTYASKRRARANNFTGRLGLGLGLPQGRGESYFNADLPDAQFHSTSTYGTERRPLGGANSTAGPSVTFFFKMRALANPGPTYVTWVVQHFPDFTGAQAPSAIQVGTAVVADSWEE